MTKDEILLFLTNISDEASLNTLMDIREEVLEHFDDKDVRKAVTDFILSLHL